LDLAPEEFVTFDFIYVTAASPEQAHEIGRKLVEERLAACVNIFESMKSYYWWRGKMEQANEAVLIAKTRSGLASAVIKRVKALHSYNCPCVVALRVGKGNPDFLEWIAAETKAIAGVRKSAPRKKRTRRAGSKRSGRKYLGAAS
jgi:periplasmic divalent cation tolerance protein